MSGANGRWGRCQYGRAARYGMEGEHAGERECGKEAVVDVWWKTWHFAYCWEHAEEIARTAPYKWNFNMPYASSEDERALNASREAVA